MYGFTRRVLSEPPKRGEEWSTAVTFGGDTYPSEYLAARYIALLGAEAVLTGPHAAAFAVEGRAPRLVVRPTSATQVAEALAVAAELGLAVTPLGGGTQLATGYPLSRLDVVVSLAHFTQVALTDDTVTAQAGVTMADLHLALARQGRSLPLDGPLSARATLGGRLAVGSLGLRRAQYGNPRDLVDDLLIARSNGALMHTGGTSNRAMQHHTLGYDLNKIMVGSLGALGVIIDATLRTMPRPTSEALVIAAFDDPAPIWDMLEDLAAADLAPVALAICSAGALQAVPGQRVLDIPDMPLVVVRLASANADVRRLALTVRSLSLKYSGAAPLFAQGAALAAVWAALDDFPATADLAATEAVIKVAALPSEIATVTDMARVLGGEHGLRIWWLADAITGLLWLRIRGETAGDFAAALTDLHAALTRRWRNVVVLGGAPDLRARLPLWGADPQNVELLRAIKGRFDPEGILNPGRFRAL
jgi:glycolate oxidase FAD binding subunit